MLEDLMNCFCITCRLDCPGSDVGYVSLLSSIVAIQLRKKVGELLGRITSQVPDSGDPPSGPSLSFVLHARPRPVQMYGNCMLTTTLPVRSLEI